MMYVPPIVISEKIRGCLAKSIGVLHCVCLIPSFTMLALGVLIETTIRDKIRFIENYNGAILPALLLSIGATSVVAHLVCGKICWTNHNPVRRRLWSRYLLPTMIVSTVIFLLELVSGVLCYSHVTELDKSFKRGILTNMKDYKDDVNVKEEVDVLQIEFSCCGSIAYTDWFRTAWIHEDYLNDVKLQSLRKSGFDDGFISDDVPFSCCSSTSMRPCIHHHVHDNDLHYNYDYRASMTINKKGCAITLMEYYSEWILMKAGAIAIGLSFFQSMRKTPDSQIFDQFYGSYLNLFLSVPLELSEVIYALITDREVEEATNYFFDCMQLLSQSTTADKNQVILMVLTRILQTSISQSLSADNPEAPAIGYLCNCNCTRPKDILSIPHIRLLSKRGSSKKEESLEKQTEAPEIQLFLPANVQDHGDSFDSSFDDFDDTQVNLPVDDSGHVPLDGLDHREYINDPLYVPMGSDHSKYVHDPLYENVQTRTDIGGVRVTNVPLEEPLYENIPNREDKLYELIDVDEEHIYHDEEVERYLSQREKAGAHDNVKNEDPTLYENFYKANHTDNGRPNTSSRFGEMMQRDHSNSDENISFHSIVSVPSAVAYPPPFIIDHKQDDTYVQEDPGHHNINNDLDVFRSSYESLVSRRQPKPPNTPSPSHPFTTPQQTHNPPPTSPTFRSDPPPEQTHFTDVRPKEGQQHLPPPPLPPRPPPPPPPPPSWIAKSDVRGMSEHNPNKTKNATDDLRGLRRGSLFKVRTSTGSYLSMYIQDKVDN